MTHWTLVPQRGLSQGKSRLAPVLDPVERRVLNGMLLERVLRSVACCEGGLEHCLVVSADEAALSIARHASARVMADPPGADLNRALEAARQIARNAGATSILVLAADLPWVGEAALRRLRDGIAPGQAAIIADKHGSGTNGLLLPAWLPLGFSFGVGSLERHIQACRGSGIEPCVWRDENLAFDLDLPSEYLAWRRSCPRPQDRSEASSPPGV